jgi:phosphoglycolate phosphatase-like HAD superfamily hydrolase
MIYIFDIDGTLADLSHRLHLIKQEPKDWDGFFAACASDKLLSHVADIAVALDREHTILMVSGRSETVRKQTAEWLDDYGIPCDGLYMRKAGDHRPDHVVKAELLDALGEEWDVKQIAGIFEDRKQVVDMYRAKGLAVFQVADGNF